ncbi:MAG: hypothetical protein JO216_19130 [Hyphomicrobiales bacterium]|nr:hypothetical protein [Hyphomicrobiales bacterium]
MKIRIAAMAMLALPLAGCVTGAQREASSIRVQAAMAADTYNQCLLEVATDPQFAGLARYMPLDGSPITIEQKANQALATPEQGKAILAWRSRVTPCREAVDTAAQGYAPDFVPALLRAQNASDVVWVKLAQREVSWGSALQEIASIQATSRERRQQVARQIESDLQRRHQAELAQQQAVVNTIATAAIVASAASDRRRERRRDRFYYPGYYFYDDFDDRFWW